MKSSETQKRIKKILTLAEKNKNTLAVIPPQDGYPFPSLGYRLMSYNPSIPKDKNFGYWVHIQFGTEQVLNRLATKFNSTQVNPNRAMTLVIGAPDPTVGLIEQ